MLNQEQIVRLANYKHSAEKTMLENWLKQGPLDFCERKFPSFLSANSVTLIGQLPIIFVLIMIMSIEGLNISGKNLIDPRFFLCGAVAVEWFSMVDIIDGMRARRLKVGSPLGRIIDEGGDCIVQSAYSAVMAYAFAFDNPVLEMVWLYMNIGFFGMECRFQITGKLVMYTGEISSVEIETFLAILLCLFGIFGGEGL